MATGVFGTALDAITYAGIDTTNDMLTVCDANGDNAGTGPEDKRIAAVEFIKRSIASGDVGWMSTLGIASVDHAGADADRFLIWDNSATAFKLMTGSDLLNKTFSGVSVAGLSAFASISSVDGAADYFPVFDASTTAWRKLLASNLIASLAIQYSGAIVSTPTTVTTAYTGKRFSNITATQIIEFDLPAATVGLRYGFSRVANYAIRLDPNGSETIGDGGAGKYLELTTRGGLEIECFVAGSWEVTGGSSVYAYEV